MNQTFSVVKTAIDSTYIKFKLHQKNLDRPKAKFPLYLDTTRFIIKTADTLNEFQQVLKLRYDVFLKEQLNKKMYVRIDIDEFDFMCDHLLIIEKTKNEVVGTYRLISTQTSPKFYSESEFDLSGLLAEPGIKLELGRACIRKDYRSGAVMTLLWRGLSDYMKLIGARFLFGCSSVKTIDPLVSSLIVKYLKSQNAIRDDLGIVPTKPYRFDGMQESLKLLGSSIATFHEDFAHTFLPPLLKGYLRAGAKVSAEPALDRDFKCIDFLTVLDLEQTNQSYRDKFNLPGGAK